MKSEFELIEILKKKIPRNLQGVIGIGDDTGVFGVSKGNLLVTTDAVVDEVDFFSKKIKPEMAGRKALAINLSDIAAMGGTPLAFVITLGVPMNFSEKWLERFYSGMMKLARRHKVLCVGGDMTGAQQFFASITLIGKAGRRTVTRGGARKGDWVGVTGDLGGSIIAHHFSFEPRLKEGRFLADAGVTAMMDISDGLGQDLGHLLKASGLGVRLKAREIPLSKDAFLQSSKDGIAPLQHAFSDGEDFELLFTVPSSKKDRLELKWRKLFPKVRLSWIGRMIPGKGKITWEKIARQLEAPPLKRKGFTHF